MTPIRPLLFVGEALVEVMRPGVDQPLDETGAFVGPFPSGAPAIAADAAARMGAPVTFIGTVGDDAFGRLLLARFERDGVDASRVARAAPEATGVAFVSYQGDGSRTFVFHLGAAGRFEASQCQPENLEGVRYVHIAGSTAAFNTTWQVACLNIARWGKERGATLSFDPNLRGNLDANARTAIRNLADWSDILLPSAGEAAMLLNLDDDADACRRYAERGKAVIEKRGSLGCRLYKADGPPIDIAGLPVEEVDPTGAGDAFAGGLLAALYRGEPMDRALHFANACGALAVTKKGPMEGSPTWDEAHAIAF